MATDHPNILLFIPHDLGDYLGCYGHASVRSPHLDALAQRGVRLSRYFTAAPECTPSRAGMMTGLYTHQSGLMGLCHRGWELNPGAVHLGQRLWQAGYRTHLFGLQHETGGSPARLGYDAMHAQQDRRAGPVCAQLAAFLGSDRARGEQPWFACAGFSHVHRPWPEATAFDPGTVDVPPYLPDNPQVRLDLARFHQSILDMDTAIGTALQALASAGLTHNTVVIFTTDHGSPFPRAKSTFYDPGIRIPLIVHWPGRIEGGTVLPALTSNLDLAPTVLDLAGVAVPDGLEGRTAAPLLLGQPHAGRDALFGALFYDAFYDPMHSVRTATHKYIRSFAVRPEEARGADPEVLARHHTGSWIRADDSDVQNSLSWESMRNAPHAPPPAEELYDLRVDPLEQQNLVDDAAAAAVLGDMRDRLHAMMVRTNSPLLHGHVSPDLSRTRNQRG